MLSIDESNVHWLHKSLTSIMPWVADDLPVYLQGQPRNQEKTLFAPRVRHRPSLYVAYMLSTILSLLQVRLHFLSYNTLHNIIKDSPFFFTTFC